MVLKDLRREIAGLARIMNAHDIAELEIAAEGLSVKLRRGHRVLHEERARYEAEPGDRPGAPGAKQEPVRPDRPGPTAREDYISIVAPMVGTFYRASAPDAQPYVEVGSIVSPGQTVCIIEAMKIMNEIQSEVRGRVVEILVENAEPVEYGQPLFVLEKL
ncbi:MAG: acetyl-CoA carboxylase biotin carboxyl carrier protein [Bacillota bacterium]